MQSGHCSPYSEQPLQHGAQLEVDTAPKNQNRTFISWLSRIPTHFLTHLPIYTLKSTFFGLWDALTSLKALTPPRLHCGWYISQHQQANKVTVMDLYSLSSHPRARTLTGNGFREDKMDSSQQGPLREIYSDFVTYDKIRQRTSNTEHT